MDVESMQLRRGAWMTWKMVFSGSLELGRPAPDDCVWERERERELKNRK